MEESKNLKSIYGGMQAIIYIALIVEMFVFITFPFTPKIEFVIARISNIPLYGNIIYCKLFVFLLIAITSVGTRARKSVDLNVLSNIILPLFIGCVMFFSSIYFILERKNTNYLNSFNLIYMSLSFFGAIFINVSFDNISKIIRSNFLKDKFNLENESFEQTQNKIDTPCSVNIPMKFFWKKKYHSGWINIANTYKGTLLIGTTGSGKSFSVINSYIRQHSAKNFSLVVYDFKFPELSKIAYYHFLLNKKKKIIDQNFSFNVVNFSDIEYSRRVNPLKREYIEFLADATETSEALYESLQKGDAKSGGAQFFKTSAINFLAACIYFFSRYENGKYSDLPHILAFINRSYSEIFKVLFSNPELQSILSPFKTAYDNKAFEQLEGQIGSLKVQISRLATKESFWVFSGDDFNLKVSDPKNPCYLMIANNPKTMSMNSALNALILNRLTRLVNSPDNKPTSIIVDESPTLYFHQIANLLSTARYNRVAVLLGLQEIPQLEEQYGKSVSNTITSVIGNVISGSARSKYTLEWLQTLFGKVKQKKEGVTIRRAETTININEQMDYLIPAAKIANLRTGSLVGQVGVDFDQKKLFVSTVYNCETTLDLKEIKKEKLNYVSLPKFYTFGSPEEKERKLRLNFSRIYDEVEEVVAKYNL